MGYLIVFLGAGVGGALRHGVNRLSAYWFGFGFPWGTVFVNIVGSFMMGLLAGLFAERFSASQDLRLFLTTGVLGGFTTFSAFSLDVVTLWQRGQTVATLGYVTASFVLSVAGFIVGLYAFRPVGV